MAKKKIKDPRRVGDHWTRKAKADNFPARSVYKLEEADLKYGLLKPGARVLDLGCSPGSWTIYASRRVGPQGSVIGVDLNRVEGVFASNIVIRQADVLEMSGEELSAEGFFDVVLSDMAPKTTGTKSVDQARSADLARAALAMARDCLRPGGALLFKIFQGPDAEEVFKEAALHFGVFRLVKPKSSRSFSPEIFGLGLGYRG